ncbi:hypothetical protein ES703_109063 [subsurface metagenome]
MSKEKIKKLSYKQRYKFEKSLNKYLFIMFIGILLIVCGATSNFTAIESNDCRMPVYRSIVASANSDEYFSFWDKSEVNYFFLTDRFVIGEGIHSIGDFLCFIGGFILLFNLFNLLVRKWTKKYERTIK